MTCEPFADRLDKITVTEIRDLITVPSPRGRYEEMTDRKCYGLSFCAAGQITYTHRGQQYVSDPCHAVILPKGESYAIHGDKKGIFPVINFDCLDFLCDTVTVLPISAPEPFINDFEQMKNLLLFDGNRTKLLSIFYQILNRLHSACRQEPHTLLPAIRYLESHYASPNLTNAVLAKQCNISEIYFRKLFVKIYGVTPKQFIIDTRLSKAKQLLTDGVLKIGSISEKCGFASPYHFCRLFKQKTGITPSEFMRQNRLYKI